MSHKFVLEALDPETNSLVSEFVFEVSDIADFDAKYDFELLALGRVSYDLEADEAAEIAEDHALADFPKGWRGRVGRERLIPERSYVMHTGRELILMLSGKKPFAAFVLDGGLNEEQALSGQPFHRFVDAGRIMRREAPATNTANLPMVRVMFALPGEEWRFDKFTALWDDVGPWDERKEYEEGVLLGYTEAEMTEHMAHFRNRKR